MHRVLYEEKHGPLGDLVGRHECDNRMCINLDHIIPGTPAENAADRNQRGRNNPPVGERAGNTSLTTSDIASIRASSEPQSKIAAKHGISQSQVSRIKNFKRWNAINIHSHLT